MALLDNNQSLPFGSVAIYRVVATVSSVIEYLRAWYVARQTEKLLRSLSDHELNDIGLSRSAIGETCREMLPRRI